MPLGKKTHFEVSESAEDWTVERQRLLEKKISELGLKLEGSPLEKIVLQLYDEMQRAGIELKPPVFLADEWGCPEGVPAIGIPFFLADERLSRIEEEMMEMIEAKTDKEILSYLRHEAGHAFNYAYKLYETEEWHEVFGPYSRPYRDDYQPNPFSRNYVRHIPGWYAQKHPDEDFAETFAVWLSPDSNWREYYKDWGCYKKLLYVDRTAKKLGKSPPKVAVPEYSEELTYSLAEHYRRFGHQPVEVPAYFDGDLKDIFEQKVPNGKESDWLAADKFLSQYRRTLVWKINYWTGLNDSVVRGLVNHFIERAKSLKLWVDPRKSTDVLLEIVAYATTLSMNKLYKGDFVIK